MILLAVTLSFKKKNNKPDVDCQYNGIFKNRGRSRKDLAMSVPTITPAVSGILYLPDLWQLHAFKIGGQLTVH